MASVGAVWLDVVPSAAGFSQKLQQEVTPAADQVGRDAGAKMGAGMANAMKAALAAVSVAAIGGLLKDSIGAASDLAEEVSKAGVIFGSSAGQVEEFASTAATALGQSQQQAIAAASTFATFGKAAGLSGDELVGFSTGLVTLASDMASFSNTTPEQAILAIGAAMRGETEPIRAYGVMLDDASMKQKALELGIISTTTNALTPQQKVLAAQALIYEQTTDAQGDFARTSDGLANSQRILAALWEDAKAALGAGLLPAVEAIIGALKEAAPAIGQFAEQIGSVLGAGLSIAVPLLTVVADAVSFLTDNLPGGAAAVAAYIAVWRGFSALGGVRSFFDEVGQRMGQMVGQMAQSSDAGLKTQKAFSGFGTALAGLGAAAPVVGIAFAAVSNALGEYERNAQAAAEASGKMMQGMLQGGVAAQQAAANLQAFRADMEAFQALGGPMGAMGDAMEEGLDRATASMERQQAAMTPLQAQQQALSAAQADYQYALENYGANSPQAIAASNALAQANAQVTATQDQLTAATKSTTQALQQSISMQLTATSSAYAQTAADYAVKDAQAAYTASLTDGTMSAQQRFMAEKSLADGMITGSLAAAKVAEDQAKLAGVTDTSAAATDAQIAKLEQYAAEAGGNVPAAIQTMIAGLQAEKAALASTGGQATTAAGQVNTYSGSLNAVPSTKTTTLSINDQATPKIQSIGNFLKGLVDKVVTVTTVERRLNSNAASSSGMVEPRYAAGGRVSGIGTGTSDSILAKLSNGEHVLTAREVTQAGGQDAIYALRAAIRRGWKVPGYANGGGVGVTARAVAQPMSGGIFYLTIPDLGVTLRAVARAEASVVVSSADAENARALTARMP